MSITTHSHVLCSDGDRISDGNRILDGISGGDRIWGVNIRRRQNIGLGYGVWWTTGIRTSGGRQSIGW